MASHQVAIPLDSLDENLSALVEAGSYESEREVIRDALEALLKMNPTLRLELTITLWRQGKISMGRAIEIAQTDRETFKAELGSRGIDIVISDETEDILKADKQINQIRTNR